MNWEKIEMTPALKLLHQKMKDNNICKTACEKLIKGVVHEYEMSEKVSEALWSEVYKHAKFDQDIHVFQCSFFDFEYMKRTDHDLINILQKMRFSKDFRESLKEEISKLDSE